MSHDVGYCRPDDTLDRAARLMWDRDCGCVPVCTGNGAARVVGMLTDRDICMAALFTGKPLGELRAYEAMSRDVRACMPRDRAAHVERAMRERQVRRVPVVDDEGSLIGIVSLADIARASGAPRNAPGVSDAEIAGTLAAICRPHAGPRRA
jgi:CBS domain-containing protein